MKNWIKKTKPVWLKLIPNTMTLVFSYILFMLLLARQYVDSFVNKNFGEALSSVYYFIESNKLANLASTLFLIIGGIILSCRTTKKQNPGWRLLFSLFLIIYVFSSEGWIWAQTLVGIDYRQLIVLFLSIFATICLIKIVLQILDAPRMTKTEKQNTGFSVTTEQESMQDTGWKPYVENLVSKLLKTNLSEESFAVGVSGVWGSGKSSFLKEVERELNKKVYLIRFNPWNGSMRSQITSDFFDTLISGLSVSSPQRKSLSRYSKLLSHVEPLKSHVQLFESVFDNITPSIADAKAEAEKVINKMPLPVVVVIDDLDRLEAAELMEVLKLIRITANFKNLIFIVAYDKGYVTEALKGVGGDTFMKKIISLEICLPDYEAYIMAFHLYMELKKGLANDSIIKEIEHDIFSGTANHKITFYLPTFRDVKRFANLFCLDINSFIRTNSLAEINVRDFFFVELLHYYDNDAYQYLKTRPTELISLNSSSSHKPTYSYMEPGTLKIGKKNDKADELKLVILEKYKDGFSDILWVLFGQKVIDSDNMIRYPVNYAKYFSFRVNNDSISLKEFNEFLSLSNTDQIDSQVNGYCRGMIRKQNSLYNHLVSQTLDPMDNFRSFNLIYALIELWPYYPYNIEAIGKSLFDKRLNKTPGIIQKSFREAVIKQINKSTKTAAGIQDLLRGLVRHEFIDLPNDDSYYDYESVVGWDLLKELSELNFTAILKDRQIPIQDITDKKSALNRFLKRAVAEVGLDYIDDNNPNEYKRSLLIDKLITIYSGKDHIEELELFFKNLDPRTYNDYYYDYPDEFFDDEVMSNIESVFGNECGFRDFYAFIKEAFAGHIEEVNNWLIRLNRKPIEEDTYPTVTWEA